VIVEPPTIDDLLETIRATASLAISAALCGNQNPRQRAVWEWMTAAPCPGDMIVEQSTRYRTVVGAVGRFLKCELLPSCSCERENVNLETCTEHPPGSDERCRGEHYVWLLRPADAAGAQHRHRWHNANFVRVPTTSADHAAIHQLEREVPFPGRATDPPRPKSCCPHGYSGRH
jgi:hypothetical protein